MRAYIALAGLLGGVLTTGAAQTLPVRVSLQKKDVPLNSPQTYLKRTRTDPKTGKMIEYDPQPSFVELDRARGLYRLQWLGYDGQRKSVVYERPDKLEAEVAAEVSRVTAGRHQYRYQVRVLEASQQPLRHFLVQTLTGDAKGSSQSNIFSGAMSNKIAALATGKWFAFSVSKSYRPIVGPGQIAKFELESKELPGLVECKASGTQGGLDGAGEEPPAELFDALPGYEAWLYGRTIGPVARLAELSRQEKIAQLREWLPEFERAGWLTPDGRRRYDGLIGRGDLRVLVGEAESDHQSKRITSEVIAIVRALTE